MYRNFRRGFQDCGKPFPQTVFSLVHASVCPDTTGFPSRSIPTSESGVTRKNSYVPCFNRSQSVMAASRAMIRS